MIRHAGLLARYVGDEWRGALVEGPSGCGKSDLALRALEHGWRLVADDRTLIWRVGDCLYGRPPGPIAGLIEVRGQGPIAKPFRRFARIRLLARCMQGEPIERLPEVTNETLLGVALPVITLAPLEASALAKLGEALTCL